MDSVAPINQRTEVSQPTNCIQQMRENHDKFCNNVVKPGYKGSVVVGAGIGTYLGIVAIGGVGGAFAGMGLGILAGLCIYSLIVGGPYIVGKYRLNAEIERIRNQIMDQIKESYKPSSDIEV